MYQKLSEEAQLEHAKHSQAEQNLDTENSLLKQQVASLAEQLQEKEVKLREMEFIRHQVEAEMQKRIKEEQQMGLGRGADNQSKYLHAYTTLTHAGQEATECSHVFMQTSQTPNA